MKFFNKQRVVILSALAAVVVVLLTVIISLDPGLAPAATDGETVTHETIRDARVGLASNVEWETNFGGSGDDVPVSCITLDGKPYIFGNTSSSDLDFNGGGVFATRLSGFGKTEKFATYADPGSSLHAAALTEGGFALTVNGNAQYIIFANAELEVVATLTLDRPEACDYNIVDVGFNGGNLFVFRQSFGGGIPLHVVCDIVSQTGTHIKQRVFKQTLDLTYRGFFPAAGLVTVFEESGGSSGCATFAEWTVSGNIDYKRVVTAQPYKTLAVYPSQHGWLALTTASGETHVRVFSFAYSQVRSVDINFAGVRSGELFYSSATAAYYASVYVEGEINGLFSLGGDVTGATKFALPSYSSMYYYGTATADVIALVSGETVSIATITATATKMSPLTDYAKSPIIMRSGDNWFATFAAKEKAAIIGGNFGGYDVAVAKIKF